MVDFQGAICIIMPDAQRAQQHVYIGVTEGISAKYRTGSTPSSGEKSIFFTGQEYSLRKEKIHLYLLLQTFKLYFLYPDSDVQSHSELYMYWSFFAIQCQAQSDERGKWLDP